MTIPEECPLGFKQNSSSFCSAGICKLCRTELELLNLKEEKEIEWHQMTDSLIAKNHEINALRAAGAKLANELSDMSDFIIDQGIESSSEGIMAAEAALLDWDLISKP